MKQYISLIMTLLSVALFIVGIMYCVNSFKNKGAAHASQILFVTPTSVL